MAARLGNVLFWASILIGGAWIFLIHNVPFADEAARQIYYVLGGVVVLIGMAARYVLTGGNREQMTFWSKTKPASENPFRASNPDLFDKGARINQCADELRRLPTLRELASISLGHAIAALQTALGNEVAATVLERNPNFSADQKQYVIDEILDEVRPGLRQAA
jgi:hypothetical protein